MPTPIMEEPAPRKCISEGHAFGVRVDGPSGRGLTRLRARRFSGLTAPMGPRGWWALLDNRRRQHDKTKQPSFRALENKPTALRAKKRSLWWLRHYLVPLGSVSPDSQSVRTEILRCHSGWSVGQIKERPFNVQAKSQLWLIRALSGGKAVP